MSTFPDVQVVGMHFRGPDAKEAAASLEPGTMLRLEREPDNQYDPNAIKVFFESLWIGYIERGQAAWIAPLMDEGATPTCTVTEVREIEAGRKTNLHPIVSIVA